MAAGGSSGGSLESTLDRKFLNVTNTMDSIQGLSAWCIENKKYHSVIVRQWIKHVRKATPSHRLNLLYLANDVIQNCKRKNAIVYRTAFSEVLLDAFLLINSDSDAKVIKSVVRILNIWEERNVYEGNLISDLRSALVKEESPPETPVEQRTPTESKAEIRSRIVAEFVPQAFIDQLSKYQRCVDEVDLREKQLTAMRLDICNSETLKKLKDKAGGKKYSRDFEEGNAQLQEFVKFLEKQNNSMSPILEALRNADVFYEMQYKEVKIVANAYQTFANRVNHLKRKLDSLKSTLPSLDDSPLPSPSADAPSPTGSESPFRALPPDPDLDGSALDDDAEPPAPSPLSSPGASPKPDVMIGENDNIEVEDMELSDEEVDSGGIIVEEQSVFPAHTEAPDRSPQTSDSSLVPPLTAPEVAPLATPHVAPVSAPVTAPPAASVAAASVAADTTAPGAASIAVSVTAPAIASVEGVDLGKIGSFLNSLSSAIKSTGPPQNPKIPLSATTSVDTTSAAIAVLQDTNSLTKLLNKVDMTASDLLSALTKVQAQGGLEGISSLFNSPSSRLSASSAPVQKQTPLLSTLPSTSQIMSTSPVILESPIQSPNDQSPPQPDPLTLSSSTTEPEPSTLSDSLESKIHSFLQGNPAFSAFDLGFSSTPTNAASPAQEGTPVRDEGGSTPTQDEVMDKTMVALTSNTVSMSETSISLPQQTTVANGQPYCPYPYTDNTPQQTNTSSVPNYQQILAQIGDVAPGAATNISSIVEKISESGWLNRIYRESGSQQTSNVPPVLLESTQSGQFPYQNSIDDADISTSAYLPPHSGLHTASDYYNPPCPSDLGGLLEQQAAPLKETPSGVSSLLTGVIVHDHQHKSVFHQDEPPGEPTEYLDDRRHEDELFRHERYQDDPYRPPHPASGEPYLGPRMRGRLTPPLGSPEDEYYDYSHGASLLPRQPLLPRHPEMRGRGMRPPLRPPPPRHYLGGHPRPPFPGVRAPEPWIRGKRPGPTRRGGGPNFPPKRPFTPRRR